MQIRGTTSIQSTSQVNLSNKVQTIDTPSVSTHIDTVDQVDISGEAQALASMNNTTDIRAERVAEIRHQIETGQYETSEKLNVAVDRMLDELA